MIFGYP